MTIELHRGDITAIEVDAIVNAANSSLLGGGGVDGTIHRKGGKQILDECMLIRQRQGGCKTGEAVYTSAGELPAQYVIHTVGPVWRGGKAGESQLLKSCYFQSMQIAKELKLKTISFPNISTGIYGYPKPEAAKVVWDLFIELKKQPSCIERALFVCFDEENYQIYSDLFTLQ